METLVLNFSATKSIRQRAHVGVVGSGELEILVEPNADPQLVIEIRTGITGFEQAWQQVVERFAIENDYAAKFYINDFGATPGVVSLRLKQALEVSK